jgi:hypothetical protein
MKEISKLVIPDEQEVKSWLYVELTGDVTPS